MEQVNQQLGPYFPASFNACSESNNNVEMHGQSVQPKAFNALGCISNDAPVILYNHNCVNFLTQLNNNCQIQANQGQQQASNAMITDCNH
eukprot:3395771-Rhodomonas_salina.1